MTRTVLVTDAGRGSAVAIIRSLGRAGWRVVAGDPRRAAPGRWSRHVDAWVTYPDPRRHPEAAIEALARMARRERVDLLFPVTDDVIVPLLDVRETIERHTALALPATEALRTAADKGAVTAMADRCGVPVPATVRWSPGDPAPALRSWPVVVKPLRSRTVAAGAGVVAHDVTYALDAAALDTELGHADGPVLLQEYVHGAGHGVEVLARDGEVVAAFQHRRIREYPPSGGASSCREAVAVDPELLAASERLLGELRWTGLAMVEFKIGPSGWFLMEINGRVWGSLPLAVAAGVDFPAMAAALHLGDPFVPPPPARLGARSRNVELELRWAAAVLAGHRLGATGARPTRMQAVGTAVRLLSPREGYDVLDRRDPLPGVVDAAQAVVRTVRRVVRP